MLILETMVTAVIMRKENVSLMDKRVINFGLVFSVTFQNVKSVCGGKVIVLRLGCLYYNPTQNIHHTDRRTVQKVAASSAVQMKETRHTTQRLFP